jgi:hypothetical protein
MSNRDVPEEPRNDNNLMRPQRNQITEEAQEVNDRASEREKTEQTESQIRKFIFEGGTQ